MSAPLSGPVLVLLDHHDDAVRPSVLELLTAARSFGAPVHGVWFGDGLEGALDALAGAGVEQVHRVGGLGDAAHLAAPAGDAVAEVATLARASALLVTSTFENKELATRVGVRTRAGVVVDADDVALEDGRVVAEKTVFAGTWTTRCVVTTPLAVVALKAGSIQAEPAPAPSTPQVVDVHVTPSGQGRVATLVERTERPASVRPELSEAQVVVAGGRGTNGDFSAVEELADVLGGAVGATRVATDEGWIGHDAQIGQTGVTVAPRLYIGAGISGAVHHRGGMQASGTIVAVNSDPESPIFEIADFGIVGDLFTVLPQAAAELRRLQG
ncbi:electron transfer flavoprotein subunit alpha/FixB family protein [Cellulomonas fimi]|uniref:Electron transfer flavoprotein subunit alpha/FixB family protein n=1 Tax=Cellulomonas fimi TaxID=1708 RepID=A0A7Y0M2Y9_CELFI|nr:electron transfer flavoprotein subunit alpha/FixB family protein [Cellulomonas fimi]NMR21532.1 electron transfer flavoprotein subunit alpha/FixB family protein [Cellulomonas fimi]